jgi:cytochrome c-type biogenesis protein CcmH/NrfF
MSPMVLLAVPVVLVILMIALPESPSRRRHGLDYEAMADVESHDVEDMLDAIAERRARTGRREMGEELADELLRGTWD